MKINFPTLFSFFYFFMIMSTPIFSQDKYFGVWQTGTGSQYWRVVNSLSDWSTWNTTYYNQGLRLVDFEKYEENGQDKYFGVWKPGTGTQYTRVVNSLNDWSTWDNSYFNQGLRLADFEKYDIGSNPVCTHSNTIPTNCIVTNEMSNCDDLVKCFMEDYDIPGATFALAKNGKMAYMSAFGHTNAAKTYRRNINPSNTKTH